MRQARRVMRMALIPQHAWEEVQGGVLTVSEAADLLRVTPRTIYRWLRSGDLVWTTAGKRKRIPRKSVERMLARGIRANAPAATG